MPQERRHVFGPGGDTGVEYGGHDAAKEVGTMSNRDKRIRVGRRPELEAIARICSLMEGLPKHEQARTWAAVLAALGLKQVQCAECGAVSFERDARMWPEEAPE